MGHQQIECQILDSGLRNRLKSPTATFDAATAFKLERRGHVRLLDVISTWNPPTKWDGTIESGKPFIVWLEDQPDRQWGAEFSSRQVIKVGKELGYQIHYMGQKNFSAGALIKADLIILNNFAFLDDCQFRMLMNILFEQGVPYIRYEHDAFFCIHRSPLCRGKLESNHVRCKNCANTKFHYYSRKMLMWKLFSSSVLNVFISPLQRDIHKKALGEVVDPSFLLLPPIDTKHFKAIPGIQRDPNLVVSMTGKIWYANKGLPNLLEYVRRNPKLKFEVYTKPHPQFLNSLKAESNVSIKGIADYQSLPRIYNRAQKVIHVPTWPEAAGRTIMEGFLCGCEPVMNSDCGVSHFDFPWKERDQVAMMLKLAPYQFWDKVCESMSWDKLEVANAPV